MGVEQVPETPPAVPWARGGPPSLARRLHVNDVGPLRRVNLATGEVFEERVDLRIPGRGLDVVWARRYRSRRTHDSPLGHGWTHGYDVSVAKAGTGLELRCWGRRDVFQRRANGTYTRRQFFVEGRKELDGTYTFTFPDRGEWRFHALGPAPEAGKLAAIVDRHGNQVSLDYDAQGRLETLTDTLGRALDLSYGPDGRLASVTDFSGRTVVYEHYGPGEPGGSAGDLKSVRSPIVTGTPNGNDFPAGKTVVYTYSKGFADQRLNHNLLTITDAKGQTFLRNVYHRTTRATSIPFDRVVRQVWGDAGERIDVHYARRPRGPGKLAALGILATVNDRVGNVCEYEYDDRNRLVASRRYTGRADPDRRTTGTGNRPAGRLRPSDPDYYETRYAWNGDGLCTRMTFPEGNELRLVYESSVVSGADVRSRGNLRRIVRLPGARGGSHPALVEELEYDSERNLPTLHRDARGNASIFTRDAANGDLLQVQHRVSSAVEDFEYNSFGQVTAHVHPDDGGGRRRDEFTYHASGDEEGYLKEVVVDALNTALTTTYQYDAVGNVVAIWTGRGNDSLYVVNALDQVVRWYGPEVDLDGTLVRYERDFWYDANDNPVRVDVLNVDDAGGVGSNPHLTTSYEYDTLNRITRVVQEVDAANDVVGEVEYDANRNPTRVRSGRPRATPSWASSTTSETCSSGPCAPRAIPATSRRRSWTTTATATS